MSKKRKSLALPDAQDIITLICFDAEVAPHLLSTISTRHLPNDKLREVFSRAKDHYYQYDDIIGPHLDNVFADELGDTKHRSKARGYQDLIEGLKHHSEDVNRKFVMDRLSDFMREQELHIGFAKMVEQLSDRNVEEVEKVLANLTSTKPDEGMNYIWASDMSRVYDGIFHREEVERMPLMIPELDNHNVNPMKKALTILMAAPKRGKSWFGIHTLKAALRQGHWKTLVITLEMAHTQYGERLVQNIWGRTLHERQTEASTIIEKDEFGMVRDLDTITHYECKSILDTFATSEEASEATEEWLENRGGDKAFNIAQFPTGAFTMRKLKALVEWLDKVEEWHPDMIILDYPGIMKLDINNKRQAMNQLYQDLRGYAVSNNIAMVAFHQTNRGGAEMQTLDHVNDETSAGEDFSVTQHADCIITYNQAPEEKEINVARLYVPLNRHGRDKYQVVISQNYACGSSA